MPAEVLHAAAVTLFHLNPQTQGYDSKGQVGAAITGDAGTYKLVCYDDKQTYLATATITSNNDSLRLQLKQDNYASFRDDSGNQFSLYFTEEKNMQMFAMYAVMAMYGAAGMPTHTSTSVDLSDQTAESVDVGDTVGLKFNGYYLGASPQGVPTLSYQFDNNLQSKHTYKMEIPTSNTNLRPDMKGFEGLVCGMSQGGKRCVVVPHACRRGTEAAGESTIIVMIEVRKVKKEEKPQQQQYQQPQQQQGGYSSPMAPQQAQPVGNFQDFQRQQQQQQQMLSIGMPGYQQPQQQQQQPMVVAAPQQMQPAQPVVQTEPVAAAAPAAAAPAATTPAGLSPEQLRTINDTSTNVTAIVSHVNELNQKVDMLSTDFKMAQKKEKPTTLTAAQLQHSVTAMLDENKNMQDEVRAKDDMIKTLENRCLDLEKKVDKFANSAHSLMEEKKSFASNATDTRLEMDRRVLKLQEEVQRSTSERDDSQRHLATVKKLLDLSEDEIRKVKGENEVIKVQSENTRMKLSHTEDSLRTEKEARKLSDERVLQLSAELSECRDTLMRKERELQEKLKKIEADRLHFNGMLEEERLRAERELTAMRDEMVTDLQSRERRFAAEKERVAEDQFARGVEKGHEEGQTEARLHYEDEMAKVRAQAMEVENDLQSDVSKLKVDIEGLQTELTGAESTISTLKSDLASLEDKHTVLGHEHTLLQESSEQQKQSHEEYSTQQQELQGSLNDKITELTAKLAKEMEALDLANERAGDSEERFRNAEMRFNGTIESLRRDMVPKPFVATITSAIFSDREPDLSFEDDEANYPKETIERVVEVEVEKATGDASPKKDDDDWSEVTRPSSSEPKKSASSSEEKKDDEAADLSRDVEEKAHEKKDDDFDSDDMVRVEKEETSPSAEEEKPKPAAVEDEEDDEESDPPAAEAPKDDTPTTTEVLQAAPEAQAPVVAEAAARDEDDESTEVSKQADADTVEPASRALPEEGGAEEEEGSAQQAKAAEEEKEEEDKEASNAGAAEQSEEPEVKAEVEEKKEEVAVEEEKKAEEEEVVAAAEPEAVAAPEKADEVVEEEEGEVVAAVPQPEAKEEEEVQEGRDNADDDDDDEPLVPKRAAPADDDDDEEEKKPAPAPAKDSDSDSDSAEARPAPKKAVPKRGFFEDSDSDSDSEPPRPQPKKAAPKKSALFDDSDSSSE